jgi:hypothetical protein
MTAADQTDDQTADARSGAVAETLRAALATALPVDATQPNNTSGNQQHYDHSSENNGGQIHNVLIGFAPAFGCSVI